MIDSVEFARGMVYWRSYARPTEPNIVNKSRPVLILSNNIGNHYSSVVMVAPITTQARHTYLPTHVPVNLKGTRSYIMLEQIQTINQRSLMDYMATITPEKMQEVDEALKISFGLSPTLISSVTGNESAYQTDLGVEQNVKIDSDESLSADDSADNADKPSIVVKEVKNKLRRRSFTEEERLQFLIEFEEACEDKSLQDDFLKRWKLSDFTYARRTSYRFKKILGVS